MSTHGAAEGTTARVGGLIRPSSLAAAIEAVLEDHPDLERDDLLAALEFGALASGQRRVMLLGSA